MGKFKEFLASDSELVMRPIREFLGFDSESGWVTLEDKEGNPYRVNIAEKIEAAKEKKAEKEAQKQKEKEQSEEDKKKFDKLMRKIEMFSKGADDIAQHNWKDLKNKAVAKFISKRMNKEFNQILDHVKKTIFKQLNKFGTILMKAEYKNAIKNYTINVWKFITK